MYTGTSVPLSCPLIPSHPMHTYSPGMRYAFYQDTSTRHFRRLFLNKNTCHRMGDRTTITYLSIAHNCLLFTLSSLASFLRLPHLSFIASNLALSISFFSFEASATMPTKNWEHANFSANFFRVHVDGSSLLSLLISSISLGVRWYFFSFCTFRASGGKRCEGSM